MSKKSSNFAADFITLNTYTYEETVFNIDYGAAATVLSMQQKW